MHLPRKSPTTRAIAISNAMTEQPVPHIISLQTNANVALRILTIFPSRGSCEEEFCVQAAEDKQKSDDDGDEISGDELPPNGLIVVGRRANCRTGHLVVQTRSISF